jgi:uncharacterized protein (DUF4415 family)
MKVKRKKSGSYRREKRSDLKDNSMTNHTENEAQELTALVQLRDEDIDTSDVPEVRDWSRAVLGKFYRPIKEPVTLRIDADVLGWLKSEGPGYQTRVNALLRATMTRCSGVETSTGNEADVAASELSSQELHFPSLERHGVLEDCNRIAELIVMRHSVFAPTV